MLVLLTAWLELFVAVQVVNIAKEYTEQLSSQKIIELMESQNCYHGLYFYLGARIAFSEVRPDILAVAAALLSGYRPHSRGGSAQQASKARPGAGYRQHQGRQGPHRA